MLQIVFNIVFESLFGAAPRPLALLQFSIEQLERQSEGLHADDVASPSYTILVLARSSFAWCTFDLGWDINVTTMKYRQGCGCPLPVDKDVWAAAVGYAGFSNSAVDRRFSTPVVAAVDGNLSKVVEKNVYMPMLCNIVPIAGCLSQFSVY